MARSITRLAAFACTTGLLAVSALGGASTASADTREVRFDRGIDSVHHARTVDRSAPRPVGDVRAALDELLAARSGLELSSAEALTTPTEFAAGMDVMLAHLAASASTERTVPNRAVRLLNEETGLRDLISMYRSALYQG